MARTPVRRLALPLVVGLAVMGWPASVAPVSAQESEPRRQTYIPGRLGAPVIVTATEDYFFHGDPADEVDTTTDLFGFTATPGPTFDRTPPADAVPALQESTTVANPEFAGNPLGVYWWGPFSGHVDGPIVVRTWWTAPEGTPPGSRMTAQINLFADPASDEPRVVGRRVVSMPVGLSPTFSESIVFAKGDVVEELVVQVTAQMDSVVLYDSSNHPSGFGVATTWSGGGIVESRPTKVAGGLAATFDYVGRESAEPTVGVTKPGAAFYAAGAFDALPDGTPQLLARTEVLRSLDGGRSWESVQPRLPVGWQGDGYTSLPPTTLDPYVFVDPDTGRVFNPELLGYCTWLNYSDDLGETWVSNPLACGNPVNDHQTVMTAPPPAGLPTIGYPKVVYYCFNRVADSSCGRSFDGGITWSPTGEPAYLGHDPRAGGFCGGLHGHLAADNEGRVFVPKGHCGFPWVAASENAGTTWRRVQITDRLTTVGHEVSLAVDTAGNLYAVWYSDVDESRTLPWLSYSRDHGATWSEPAMIAPPGVAQVNFPTIAAGAPGRIAITFPGTPVDDPSDPIRPWNSYVVVSRNVLSSKPVFTSYIANPPGDPVHRGDCRERCGGMFDFLDIQVAPTGEFWATATDTCIETPGDPCYDVTPEPPAEEDQTEQAREAIERMLELFDEEKTEFAREIFEAFENVAPDMEGVVIRQTGGPLLLPGGCVAKGDCPGG